MVRYGRLTLGSMRQLLPDVMHDPRALPQGDARRWPACHGRPSAAADVLYRGQVDKFCRQIEQIRSWA
jgi:hypothetical protein